MTSRTLDCCDCSPTKRIEASSCAPSSGRLAVRKSKSRSSRTKPRNDRDRPQTDIREASRRETGERWLSVRAMRTWIEYRDLCKVLAHERGRILRKSCETANDN